MPSRKSGDIAAAVRRSGSAAILLTGIGRDGARGMLALRRAGWHTIAQDEATSVVYGMPQAAKQLDAAVEILPLTAIAAATARRISQELSFRNPCALE